MFIATGPLTQRMVGLTALKRSMHKPMTQAHGRIKCSSIVICCLVQNRISWTACFERRVCSAYTPASSDADAYSRKHKRISHPQVPLSDTAFRLALLIHVHLIFSACCLLAPCYLIDHLFLGKYVPDLRASFCACFL
jgi:hypothetical protein